MDSKTTGFVPANAAVSPEPLIGQDEILTYTRIRAWPTVHDLIVHHGFPVEMIGDKYCSSRSAIDRWWADMRGMGKDADARTKRTRTRRGGRKRARSGNPTSNGAGSHPE